MAQPQPFLKTLFAKVPPEVRDKIYRELRVTRPSQLGTKQIGFRAEQSEDHPKLTRSTSPVLVDVKASGLAILRTCRQLYAEAHPVFYGDSAVLFNTPTEFTGYVKTAGLDHLRIVGLGRFMENRYSRIPQARKQELWDALTNRDISYREYNVVRDQDEDRFIAPARKALERLCDCQNLCQIYIDMDFRWQH